MGYDTVRYGLVKAPTDWEYLSFHRYMREGLYDAEWGGALKWNLNQQ